MTYALVHKGKVVKYPYTYTQLRQDNPQVSFPRNPDASLLAEYGVLVVEPASPPEPSDTVTKNVVEATPTLVNGVWTQTWREVEASPEEVTKRDKRNREISDRNTLKSDAFVSRFIDMSLEELSTYVDNNTGNINEIRALLKKVVMLQLLQARREFR